ncbi:uncharacterized protein [Dermacentor andersoni]|uniref:uncharacterized protein n=1 Tax=Dermacentor andersoni TaxID=34620 RepID=UPI0021554B0A|nr:uncharacterized protein LOC126543599 [Dermacentor andersoni]
MSLTMKDSPTNHAATKEPATNAATVDMSPACGDVQGAFKEHKHKPSQHSNMLRSFALQARICRLCGCLFVRDMFAKPPKSPKVAWLHWYTLYAAACLAFFLWFETDVVTRHAIELSDTQRFFTKSLLVLLHVVIIIKACCNFLTMAFGARRMIEFLQKADAFEKEASISCSEAASQCSQRNILCPCLRSKKVGIPSCLCCGQRNFLWTDIGGIVTFTAYFISYTAALIHQEQKVDHDGQLSTREIVDRVCGFVAALLFFTYDTVNFVALRHSAEVLERYVLYLKHCIDGFVGCKVIGCEKEAAQKIQAVRLRLCTVLELKSDINAIWQRSIVVSSVGLLLVTCISLYTIITEGLRKTELWIAIGYSAFTSYEFLELARVSQSLSNALQAIKDSCRKTPTMDSTTAYSHQVQYLHSTINPDDISLNGSDFFKINLSLLVSMAGSIITYTVILVQTSPEYEATPTCQPAVGATTTPAIT